MRYAAVLLVLLTVSGAGAVMGKPLEAYISEAQSKQSPEEIDQAVEIMQKALEEYPGNPTAMAYLGGYIGIQSGHASSAGNMNDAGRLVTTSFEYLDKALALDKENTIALFYRGIMGVNVPEFFGRLDQSITDLETLRDMIVKNPGSAPDIIRFSALVALGDGYDKKGEQQKALETWRNVV
ncbi:hypothetical protein LLG96_07750, partial [bacterium]|nr:hypothetical protein [bacterium]